jgi:NAD(P)-dependent dehydrogenase (short-subunit alcohol dehydrogenase family)
MNAPRIALVTGANKGIGYQIARKLAAMDGITVLAGARDEERGRAAAESLGAVPVRLDVTDEASIAAAAKWVEREYGRLDILVNNAGVMLEWGSPPSETPLDLVRRTYETNVFGVIAVTNAMLPLVRRAPAGRIVNVSSGLGSIAWSTTPGQAQSEHPILAYNSSKSALNAVTVVYANELRDTAITVNAVDPGYCATDLNNHSGYRTPEQGAIAAVRWATLDGAGPTGGFFDEGGVVPW